MAGTSQVSMTGRYFEDFEIEQVIETGCVLVTEGQIIDFAQQWDPQPFHIDRAEAARGVFGGLIASGLLTLNITYRLFFDSGCLRGTVVAGLGMDHTKFLRPVRPEDSLQVRASIMEKSEIAKNGRGRVRIRLEALNQRQETVLSTELVTLVRSRSGVDTVS